MMFTGWWLNWCMTQDAQQTQPELSPTDWVRRQTEEILKAGTTAAVDIINRPVVLFTTTGARSGKKRYVPLAEGHGRREVRHGGLKGERRATRRGTSTSKRIRRSPCRTVRRSSS